MTCKTINAVILLMLLGIGCQKTSPGVNGPFASGACKLMSESQSDSIQRITNYTYAYNSNGNLDTIYQYDAANTLHEYSLVTSAQVVSTFGLYIGTPEFFHFDYTSGDLYNASNPPTGMSITLADGNPLDTNISKYVYSYDDGKRLTQIDWYSTGAAAELLETGSYTYNSSDNLIDINTVLHVVISPVPRSIATRYDTHPTPYANIPNWPLIKPQFELLHSEDRESIFVILSRNNPLGYTDTITYGPQQGPLLDEITYTYNPQGFPITKTSSFSIGGGPKVVAVTNYTYACK